MVPRTVGEEGEAFLPIPGGAIFNTAIALGRLGEPTGFVSGISNDMFGDQNVSGTRAYCPRRGLYMRPLPVLTNNICGLPRRI